VRTWLNAAERLMTTKYGVTPAAYRISVYVHAGPTSNATVNQALSRCCTTGESGVRTGTIDILAPSAPAWKVANPRSSLGMPKADDNSHAKVLMSEYIAIGHYAVQDGRPAGGWKQTDAPQWFVQGLQEYDAIFHTTAANRDETARRLFEWARKNRGTFSCCSPHLIVGDIHNGGAAFMAFLAESFGEDVHARLLRDSSSTFAAALANVTSPASFEELFHQFQKWLSMERSR
jgi:hypothetical protein